MIERIRTHLILVAAAAAAILAGIGCTSNSTGPPDGSDTVTVIFRDGAEPLPSYFGTRDAVIRDGAYWTMQSSNNGTAAIDTLGLAEIGGSLYERRLLVRFDLTSITDCGSVAGAMLTIHFEPEDTDRTILLDAWEATVPEVSPGSWEEGLLGEGVSWLYVDHGDPAWATEGGDYLELMDSREVKADTVVTFELDPARVEAWIKIPSRNHGVLIRSRTAGQEAFLHVYMREIATVELRPELLIKYIKGG